MTGQTAEQRGTDVVLEYGYQQEDMTDAVRLILRKRGKAALIHHPVLLTCVALLGVAQPALGVPGGDDTAVAFGVMFVVWPVLMSRAPRMSAGKLVKANQHHGLVRVTVGEDGVRTVSAHVDARRWWPNYGSYAASDRYFVLRSPDRVGYCAMVIVKRGVRTAEDVDRLRAVLDRHLPRV
ncbi:hypothetical protein ABZV31_00575 [Streptomyces sp. NPDC005202]|uniref:hypothetical protein n=1 Tax=Streptomyces sp. NPDC005202 TaxID=3157021 RepID=UPI0033AB6B09